MKPRGAENLATDSPTTQSESLKLQHRLRLQSFAGILLTLLLIGAIASYQLYQARRSATLDNLQQDTRIGVIAFDAKLNEFSSIARQITSRSELRRLLDYYNRGELSLSELQGDSASRLLDAINKSPQIVGITRLDRNNLPVVEVGNPIPEIAWPEGFSETELATGLPVSLDGKPTLTITAAILTPAGDRIGTDFILFDARELQAITSNFTAQQHQDARVAFAAVVNNVPRLFDIDGAALDTEILDNNPQIRHHLLHGVDRQVHEISSRSGSNMILLHDVIATADWQLVLLAPSQQILSDVHRDLMYLLFVMLLLVVIGTAVTARLTRPTLGKILVGENELRDLNARNRELLEQALDNKRLLEDVANHSEAVIFIKDFEGRYILVNKAYAAERGLPTEQIVGKTDADFHPPETAQMFRENDLKALDAGQPIVVEESLEIDGEVHHFVTTKFPLRRHDNKIYALCGIATDITDIRQAGQLRLKLEAAEAANRAKSAFLANMSHELRTPLHGILSFSEIGAKRAETADRSKLQGYFDNIDISGQRLLLLLNDLLDLSKLEAGKLELVYGDCDLMQVIEECIEEQAPAISERSLQIRRHNHGAEQNIDCDGERIFQVVRNLLNNAIKFSPPGGKIDFELFNVADDETLIELRVTDDGSGIDPADKEMVFDKFSQSGNNPNQGSGLGLSISREIVELHQGTIRAQNSDGRGATMVVRLPRQKPGIQT